jgi:uncharacterized protein (TIGR03435 family)
MAHRTHLFLATAFAAALICTASAPLRPQSLPAGSTAAQSSSRSSVPDWQIAAGGKMAFDSASVKRNTTPPPSRVGFNFPLGPGDIYSPNRGNFSAMNLPLVTYISFAYKITANQERFLNSQLPKWAMTDRFDIMAHAQGNPTKDQMRLMMQALLADRFKLTAHYETRQVPVYALVMDTAGELGPLLQRHPDDSPCSTTPAMPSPAPNTRQPQLLDRRFPPECGGVVDMPPSAPGRTRAGARNITMELIASSMGSGLDRPVVDRTGLTGRFDIALEFIPRDDHARPAASNSQPTPAGPTFVQALKEQLGLRLEPQTGPVEFLLIDYIEQLPAN